MSAIVGGSVGTTNDAATKAQLLSPEGLRLLLPEDGEPWYSAGHARYRGDCTSIVGEVKGPTTYGTFVVAVSAEYDAGDDRTYVGFLHCPPKIAARAEVDEFGVRRIGRAS